MTEKVKAIMVTTRTDIQVGKIATRSKKGSHLNPRMNATYKSHKTIPAGTLLCLREAWRGADNEDRIYIHGNGWFMTDKENGLALDDAFEIKNAKKAQFESLFLPERCYENLDTNMERLKAVVPVIPEEKIEGLLDEKETAILKFAKSGMPLKAIAQNIGNAESTTREKLFGRKKNGIQVPGILQKLEEQIKQAN